MARAMERFSDEDDTWEPLEHLTPRPRVKWVKLDHFREKQNK